VRKNVPTEKEISDFRAGLVIKYREMAADLKNEVIPQPLVREKRHDDGVDMNMLHGIALGAASGHLTKEQAIKWISNIDNTNVRRLGISILQRDVNCPAAKRFIESADREVEMGHKNAERRRREYTRLFG
jgi:hypothetical protein